MTWGLQPYLGKQQLVTETATILPAETWDPIGNSSHSLAPRQLRMKAHLTNPEFESEFSGTPNYEPCGPKNGTGLSGVVLLRPYVPHGTKAMSEYFALGKTCREQRRTLRDEVSQNVVNDSEFKFKKVLLFNLLQDSVADLLIKCLYALS